MRFSFAGVVFVTANQQSRPTPHGRNATWKQFGHDSGHAERVSE